MTPLPRTAKRYNDPTLPKGALILEKVGKAYPSSPNPLCWLKTLLLRRPIPNPRWVLRDITFTLAPGEALGIVGQNGAGKSTLLQLIAGTLTPTTGTLRYHGRIAALLELGAGFHPEFTGRENARLAAALMGLTAEEIDARLPAIFAFADIGDALDRPVKTYSSGMFVRLAFAVATAVEPDILIIDEALAVGDGAFAKKSFARIQQLKDQGATVLFVSHALYQVERFCTRALWLDQGQIRQIGDTRVVLEHYQAWLDQQEKRDEIAPQSPVAPPPVATATPRLLAATAHWDTAHTSPLASTPPQPAPLGCPLESPTPAPPLILTLTYRAPVGEFFCSGFALKTLDDRVLASGRTPSHSPAAETVTHRYRIDLSVLNPGHYHIDLYTLDGSATLFWEHHAFAWPLTLSADNQTLPGNLKLPYEVAIN